MKCIVRILRSFESDGNHFILRLSPLYSMGCSAGVEGFPNVQSLTHRLREIGTTESSLRSTLFHLRASTSDTWSNLEVTEDIFYDFGRSVQLAAVSEINSTIKAGVCLEGCQGLGGHFATAKAGQFRRGTEKASPPL